MIKVGSADTHLPLRQQEKVSIEYRQRCSGESSPSDKSEGEPQPNSCGTLSTLSTDIAAVG